METKRPDYRNKLMNKIKTLRFIKQLADYGLAILFLVAALPKIIDPNSFADAIASFRITPEWALEPLAHFLPWFEGICAGLLVTGVCRGLNHKILVGLLVFYTLLSFTAIFRGIDIYCGCFGGKGSSAWHVIFRNISILLILATIKLITTKYSVEQKH
ncbi:MAG: MauE/DoxX family redox-associated membrane protein [Candidatus Hodarchaeota archaeon]